jgi:putative salt-induced outer membrane protein
MRRTFLASIAPLLLANGEPQSLPPPVKTMLDAAMAAGNEGEVATIAKYARAAYPESADAINKAADGWKDARRAAAARALRQAGFLDLVKGRAELGAWVTTGNTQNVGLSGTLDLTREGPQWRHKVRLLAEYQESLGLVTREHYLAAYEPNWKVGDRLYAYGAVMFEADPFLGYDERYSASTGAGYSAIRDPGLTLDVELGPAFRSTAFIDATDERNVAARGSLDLDWKLSPGVTFSQDASAYLQSANSTLTGRTALAAKLFGPLSAQVSYVITYESKPPIGRVGTDTTSRASLVYSF